MVHFEKINSSKICKMQYWHKEGETKTNWASEPRLKWAAFKSSKLSWFILNLSSILCRYLLHLADTFKISWNSHFTCWISTFLQVRKFLSGLFLVSKIITVKTIKTLSQECRDFYSPSVHWLFKRLFDSGT